MRPVVAVVESHVLNRAVAGMAVGLGMVASLCLFALILLSSADVFSRELRGVGVPGAIQYAELIMVALTFLSLADGQRHGDHVAIELVSSRLPVRLSSALMAMGYLLVTGALLWAAWVSLDIALASLERGEAKIGIVAIPVWPARMTVPLGMTAMALMLLLQAFRATAIALGWAERPDPADGEESANLL